MFGSEVVYPVTISIDYDPAADDVLPLFVAPRACEVISANATTVNDVAANTANYFDIALRNGGAAGTATTALGGTIGGTAGWTGGTPKTFTVSEGTLAVNDVVTLVYNEEGTGTFTQMLVQLNIVYGVGA
jgi:hypothetical protein